VPLWRRYGARHTCAFALLDFLSSAADLGNQHSERRWISMVEGHGYPVSADDALLVRLLKVLMALRHRS